MRLRDLCLANTPRTILWRALFALAAVLLVNALWTVLADPGHFVDRFVDHAEVTLPIPFVAAAINLVVYWFDADTRRKLGEAGFPDADQVRGMRQLDR